MWIGKSVFLAGCVALFMAGTCFGFQSPQGQASIASVKSLIRSRQYDQALEITQSALQKSPKDVRLLTLEGIILSMKGGNRDALNAFESALSLSPGYTPALRGEVQLLYELHDERAIPLLEKILKIDPKDETAQEMLATLEARRGDCPAAIGHFLLCTSVIQDHPESLEAYGYCLVQARRPEAAIPVFRQLVRLLPQPAYPKYDLAVVLVEAKQDEAALKVLDPLLTTDQRDPDVLSLASEAYEGAHNTPKAVSLLRQAIVLRPADESYY
ncbi:MAG: tetratricopeptide repeat protein, partial [Terriglobia bacterium]